MIAESFIGKTIRYLFLPNNGKTRVDISSRKHPGQLSYTIIWHPAIRSQLLQCHHVLMLLQCVWQNLVMPYSIVGFLHGFTNIRRIRFRSRRDYGDGQVHGRIITPIHENVFLTRVAMEITKYLKCNQNNIFEIVATKFCSSKTQLQISVNM